MTAKTPIKLLGVDLFDTILLRAPGGAVPAQILRDGLGIKDADARSWRHMVMTHPLDWAQLVEQGGAHLPPQERTDLTTRVQQAFAEERTLFTAAPQGKALIEQAHQQRIAIVGISNLAQPYGDVVHDLYPELDTVLSFDIGHCKGDADGMIFHHAAEKMGVPVSAMAMLGNNGKHDGIAAREAGLIAAFWLNGNEALHAPQGVQKVTQLNDVWRYIA